MPEEKKKKKKSRGDEEQSIPSLFERPKKSYKIPKPPQIIGKKNHGVRPQLTFYFDSEKDLKTVVRAFGGKKREPRTDLLVSMAKKVLKKRSLAGGGKKK